MLQQLYYRRSNYKPFPIDPHYTHLVPVQNADGGVLTRSSQFVTDCVEDNNKQYRQDDFSLQNILAVGATQMLKPTTMSNHDVAGISQQIDNALKSMENEPTA